MLRLVGEDHLNQNVHSHSWGLNQCKEIKDIIDTVSSTHKSVKMFPKVTRLWGGARRHRSHPWARQVGLSFVLNINVLPICHGCQEARKQRSLTVFDCIAA